MNICHKRLHLSGVQFTILAAFALFLGAVLLKYDIRIFSASLGALCVLTTILVLNPKRLTLVGIGLVFAIPPTMMVPVGGFFVYPIEIGLLFMILGIGMLFMQYNVPNANYLKNISGIDVAFIVFALFWCIAFLRGLYFVLIYEYELRVFFLDALRGSNYYFMYAIFAFLLYYFSDYLVRIIQTWYIAALISLIVMFFLATYRASTTGEGAFSGFYYQLYVFTYGFTLFLGFMHSRKWFLIVPLFFIAGLTFRTVMAGMFIMTFMAFLVYVYIQPSIIKKIKYLAMGLFITVVSIISIYFAFVFVTEQFFDSPLTGSFEKILQLSQIRYLIYFPSIQWRFFAVLEVWHYMKAKSLLFGLGFGSTFKTTMPFTLVAIDTVLPLVAAKMGFLGLTSYLALIATTFSTSLRLLKNVAFFDSVLVRAFIFNSVCVLPTAMVMSITLMHIWQIPAVVMFMAMLMAINSHLWKQLCNSQKKKSIQP